MAWMEIKKSSGKHGGGKRWRSKNNSLDILQMPVPLRQGKSVGRRGWRPASLGRGRRKLGPEKGLGWGLIGEALSLTAPKHHTSQKSSCSIYDLESSYSWMAVFSLLGTSPKSGICPYLLPIDYGGGIMMMMMMMRLWGWDKVVLIKAETSMEVTVCCRLDAATVSRQDVQHHSTILLSAKTWLWGYRVTLSLSSTTKWPHNLGLLMWLKSQSYLFLFCSSIIFLSMGKKEWRRTRRKEIKVEKKEEKMMDKLMPVITAFASVDLCFWWTYPNEIHERERIMNNHKSHALAGGDLLVCKHIFVSNYERHLYLGQDRAVENVPPPDGHGRTQHREDHWVLARQALGCAVNHNWGKLWLQDSSMKSDAEKCFTICAMDRDDAQRARTSLPPVPQQPQQMWVQIPPSSSRGDPRKKLAQEVWGGQGEDSCKRRVRVQILTVFHSQINS